MQPNTIPASGNCVGLDKLEEVDDAALISKLASSGNGKGASLVGYSLNTTGERIRTVQQRLSDLPHLTDYLIGDYDSDNLSAWENVLNSGYKSFYVPDGVYRFSDGIEIPGDFRFIGNGAPILGFGTDDDKHFLVDGHKVRMPGASFIFSGTGTKIVTTNNRNDLFSNVRYCVRVLSPTYGSSGSVLRGIAIIQDMVCFDSSGLPTKPSADQRADYECGIYHDDSARNIQEDVCVFGYFSKAGTIIQSKLGNDDPDYNTIIGGSTMGKVGLAIIGSNMGAVDYGLSGTRVDKCGLYTLDHHSRTAMTVAERMAYYSTANSWRCLYIDGDVHASSAEINGHYFHSCEIRTRANHAIELDHASNVQFYGGVVEQSPYGIVNSDTPMFIGSANVKRGVGFYGLRMNYISQIFNDNFSGVIPVNIVVSGDPLNGRLGVIGKNPRGGYSLSILGADGNTGDASIQFTKDANDGSSGWKMAFDVSSNNCIWAKDGTTRLLLTPNAAMSIKAPVSSDAMIELSSNAGSVSWYMRPQYSSQGQLQFRPNSSGASPAIQVTTTGDITSGIDASANVGSASLRYNIGYFAGGTQSSSDGRLKDPIRPFNQAELNAAMKIAGKLGFWTWLDDSAKRNHAGTTVQAVIEIMETEGLDWTQYGFIGYDRWDDEYETVMIDDGNGNLIESDNKRLSRAAGDLFQFRDQELDRFIMRGLAERLSKLEAKLQ